MENDPEYARYIAGLRRARLSALIRPIAVLVDYGHALVDVLVLIRHCCRSSAPPRLAGGAA